MPGSNYLQYPLNGKMGNYFTTVGTPAEMIGINPAGRVPHVIHSHDASQGTSEYSR